MKDTFTVAIHYTSGIKAVAGWAGQARIEDLRSAKAAARRAWDSRPGMMAEIMCEDGSVWTASQTHGRGMIWTR